MFRTLFATYKNFYDDFYYVKQLRALYSWIETKQSGEQWIVYINLPRQNELVRVSAGETTEIKKVEKQKSINVLTCQSGGLKGSLRNIQRAGNEISNWHPIFTSCDLEIWENKSLQKTTPLRFGLSGEEKRAALLVARRAMQRFLDGKEPDFSSKNKGVIYTRFQEMATVCVALWIDGMMRGSAIEKNTALFKGLVRAGARACRDSRFKPVVVKELKKARVEITVMSDLRLPITRKTIEENVIDATVGYCVEKDDKVGWYVPEVFVTAKFASLSELISKLAMEKAGILPTERGALVTAFNVEDFIESADRKRFLDMNGPVPQKASFNKDTDKNDLRNAIVKIGTDAADQLVAVQERDGNIPPTFNPATGNCRQIGWAQMSCALWGLASFGKIAGKEEFTASAEKGFKYVSAHLYHNPAIPLGAKIESLIYAGRMARVLNDKKELERVIASVLEYSEKMPSYEPILYANMAGFLAEQETSGKDMLAKAICFAEQVEADFFRESRSSRAVSLAKYPELAMALLHIAEKTGEERYTEKARSIFSWFVKQQLEGGAFPASTFGHTTPYTRGTGKIFEVLCSRYEENKTAILKALSWLYGMQYDEDSLYFVKPKSRVLAKGGLRHDYLNKEVWIDGTAHLLIGLSRILGSASFFNTPK